MPFRLALISVALEWAEHGISSLKEAREYSDSKSEDMFAVMNAFGITGRSAAKEMVIEGVLAIQAGENPRIMGQKLLTYLDPVSRKSIEADILKD